MKSKLLIVSLHPNGGCFHYSNEIIERITEAKEVYLNEKLDEQHNIKEYSTLKDYGFNPYVRCASLLLFCLKIFIYGKFTKRYKALLLMGYTNWDNVISRTFSWTGNPIFYVVHDGKVHLGETGTSAQKRILGTIKHSNYLIFLSEYVKNLVKEHFGIQKKYHIAAHGLIDYGNVPMSTKSKREKPILLFVGRLSEYKGINILLEGLENIPDVFEKVIIAGKSVQNYKVNSNNNKVEIIDKWLTENEIVHLLNECDILLLPYVEATQSGIATLAINYLLPSIISDVGGLKEQFQKNGAIIISPESPEDLKKAIIKLSTNRELYDEISNNLLQLRKSYSWDLIAKSLQYFINDNII